MKILITGVAGFIGSNLANHLISKGHQIIGIDDLSYGLISQVPSKVDFHKANILDKNIYNLFKKVDIVFHFAAKNCISDCQADPLTTANTNIVGTINIFEASRKFNIKKVIYAESSAIYEGAKTFPTKEIDEFPESFYAISKLTTRFFALAYKRYSNLNTIGLRYFNVYGPKQDYRRSIPPLMSAIIIKLLNGEKPIIYGSGEKRRDFIYIDDVNRFHELLINNAKITDGIYNVGYGTNYSVNEINQSIQKILKIKIKPDYKKDLPGEAFQNLADITSAKKLGWSPKIDLKSGLKLSIDYIRNNVLSSNKD
jgi:nucleoside-diphosphate-sugar epimerase